MDRYDFACRPDMKPGKRNNRRNNDTDPGRQRVPTDVKFAIAFFIIAILASFGMGARLGATAEQTPSAVACQAQ